MKLITLPFKFCYLYFVFKWNFRTLLAVLVLVFFGAENIRAQSSFITTWKSNNPGVSGSNQITIPARGNYTYVWESVDDPSVNGSGEASGEHTLTFPEEGTYQVGILPGETDPFDQIQFDFDGDRKKIVSVDQWGDIQWTSFASAYTETSNLTIHATDVPDLQQVTNMAFAFYESGIGTEGNLNAWDVSSVINMEAVFYGTRNFNQPLDAWDPGNAQILKGMFAGSRVFNQDISVWDVSQVTDMSFMFQDAQAFDQSLNGWDVSQVEDMSYMFSNTPVFNGAIEQWDVSNVKNMEGMFTVAYGFNQPIGSWNIENATNLSTMFSGAVMFNQSLNDWDVSGVTNFWGMFSGSGFNQNIGNWDLSQAANLTIMLDRSAMSCENYSNTLLGWSENPELPSNLLLGADELLYSPEVEETRNYLINTLEWSIEGDALGNCSLGIADLENIKIQVYPNPSTGIVNLSGSQQIDKIRVYDLSGKLLKTENNLDTNNFRLNLTAFAKGIYIIKTMSGEAVNTFKVILK